MGDEVSADVDFIDNGRNMVDEDNDLEGIGQSTTEIININTRYQPKWGPAEGFRENYQNWYLLSLSINFNQFHVLIHGRKDGILRAFDLCERDFKIETTNNFREKLFCVYHPNKTPKQLLGYIRFEYNAKNLGVLELTNFKAMLQRSHLGIGGTTKAEDKKQLGQHGEGLKLSALVNRRHPHNYGFMITSSGCKWVFGWNVDKKLNCRIQRFEKLEMMEQKAIAAEDDEKGLPRQAKARPWEDVSIIVGEARRCRALIGDLQTTSKIPLAKFLSWTKMTIDIDPPKDIIKTSQGDLIMHPDHKNKIYLHSLLLPSGSKSGRPFVWGYNLLHTATGRDRDTISTAQKEATKIYSIWQTALLGEAHEGQDTLLIQYIILLQRRFHMVADTYNIGNLMCEEVASLIWRHLLAKVATSNSFYFCSTIDPQVKNSLFI